MAVPLMRSYTTPGLALNVFGPSTDDITGLTIQQLNRSNNIWTVLIIQTHQEQQHIRQTF